MKPKAFLLMCIDSHIPVSNNVPLKKNSSTNKGEKIVPRSFYSNIAKLVSLISFDCRIDKDGHCKKRIERKLTYPKELQLTRIELMRKGSCCSSCVTNIGFLDSLPLNWTIIKKMAETYDEHRYGFWGTKGCKLPILLRSSICLTKHCNEELNNSKPMTYHLLEVLKGNESLCMSLERLEQYIRQENTENKNEIK